MDTATRVERFNFVMQSGCHGAVRVFAAAGEVDIEKEGRELYPGAYNA
jgi:hypothetical protein